MPHHLTTKYAEHDQAIVVLNGSPFMIAEIESPRLAGEFLDDYANKYDIDRGLLSLIWMTRARIVSRYERNLECPTS